MLLEVLLVVLPVALWGIYYVYKSYKPFFNLPGPPLWEELKLIKHSGSPNFPHVIHEFFRTLEDKYRKHGYFLYVNALVPKLMVTDHELLEMIFKDASTFPKDEIYDFFKAWLGQSVLVTNGANWKRRRTLLNPAFHASVLESFMSTFHWHSMDLVQKLREKKSIEAYSTMSRYTLEIICETTMGYKLSGTASDLKYIDAVKRTAELMMERSFNALHSFDIIYERTLAYQDFMKQVGVMHHFCSKIIEERKKSSIDLNENIELGSRKRRMALLDLMLTYQKENQDITNEMLNEEVNTIVFAGHDTTSSALTMILQCLGTYMEYQDKVREELRSIFGSDNEREITTKDFSQMILLDCIIKEVLRLYPPVSHVSRVAAKGFHFNGRQFPKGTRFFMCIESCQRNPKVFLEPNKFKPERFLNQSGKSISLPGLIPFIVGPRNCIGQRFALMEIKLTLAQILRHFTVKALQKEVQLGIYMVLKPSSDVQIEFVPETL